MRFGLGNDSAALCRAWKSSDLVGIGPGGRFLAVEVKAPDWRWTGSGREIAQAAFHANVRALGGLAMFANSMDDLEKLIWPEIWL